MSGIHHVTAISGAAERNLDFYTRVLGLRLVKKTVNFDDPGTYHLYYGDAQGQPGTILTFFPWAHAAPGRLGVGETQETAFRVPAAAIGYWTHRLVEKGVPHALEKRFGETVLTFTDPDGMRFALVGVAGAEQRDGVERRRHSGRARDPRLSWRDAAARQGRSDRRDPRACSASARSRARERCGAYRADAPLGGHVDMREAGDFLRGRHGRGSVHHVAFRAAGRCRASRDGGEAHRARHARHRAEGPQLFPLGLFPRAGRRAVRDRDRRSGLCGRRAGRERSGSALKLPRFLEPRRAELEAKLPPLGAAVA